MVRIPKRGSDPYLTARDVVGGDLATITGPVYIQDAEKSKFGKERTIITVKIKRTGKIYRWGLNSTSNDRIVDFYSEDSDLWKGKELKIQKRLMNVRGEDRDVLYAVPSEQARMAPAEKIPAA